MNTNAAEQLRAAIELANRALAGMYAAGADKDAMEELAGLVHDLKAEHNLLPQKIMDDVRNECVDCPHSVADPDPHALGTGSGVTYYECTARGPYQCPVVRECGYRDPADPLDSVPHWLKRQAI